MHNNRHVRKMPSLAEEPIIETSKGRVRGYVRQTVYDDKFYCFERVPYATPPLGKLRFKSPVEIEPWQDVLDCNEVAPKAVQFNRHINQIEGSEDCLYLNIYAKQLTSEKPLPVMVYIHGGFYCTGSPTRLAWGPDYFMMRDVIFITIGHRLGALGFLTLSDPELQVPGNAGLKDIVLALKWINQNVHNFNGDAQNVTLFGHSSGASFTHYLMLSDQAKGLFHKTIVMAGSAINVQTNLPLDMHYRMACAIGYEGANNERQILDFLMTVDSLQLAHYDYLTEEERNKRYICSFIPRVEPYETPDMILGSSELDHLRACWSNKIPIMMGITSLEGLPVFRFHGNQESMDTFNAHPEYLLPYDLASKGTVDEQRERAKKMLDFNFKGKPLNLDNIMTFCEFSSYGICHNMHRVLTARLAYSSAPTFLYRFDFDSPTFNLYRIKLCGPDVRGVSHVDELCYIFYLPQSFKLETDSAEFQTIVRMVDMWTAFAKYSDPNVQSIKPTVWKPVERFGPRMCLNISHKISFIDWPESKICNKWDELYEEAEERLI